MTTPRPTAAQLRLDDASPWTARVALTRGKVALIDAADLYFVSAYKWYASRGQNGTAWYAVHRTGSGCQSHRPEIRMHRLILAAQPGQLVDHINGDGLDNRRCNLRICDESTNQANRHMIRGMSRYRGVTTGSTPGTWRVYITVRGHQMYLGDFPTQEEAARVYDAAALQHFGAFACVNFPSAIAAAEGAGT